MTNNEIIGQNIKKYRIARHLSQQELSELVGLKGKSSLSRIESGSNNIPSHRIKQFAEALCVSTDDLFKTDEETDRENEALKMLPYIIRADENQIRLLKRLLNIPQ